MSVKIFQKEKKNKFCTSQRDKSRVSIQNLINYFLLDFLKNFRNLNADNIAVIFPMPRHLYAASINHHSYVVY